MNGVMSQRGWNGKMTKDEEIQLTNVIGVWQRRVDLMIEEIKGYQDIITDKTNALKDLKGEQILSIRCQKCGYIAQHQVDPNPIKNYDGDDKMEFSICMICLRKILVSALS